MEPESYLPGSLDLMIMAALQDRDLHGYGISERIGKLSQGKVVVKEGSLYPALKRLEQSGAIVGEWKLSNRGRKAKVFALTAVGDERFTVEEKAWNSSLSAVRAIIREGRESQSVGQKVRAKRNMAAKSAIKSPFIDSEERKEAAFKKAFGIT